MYTYIQFIIYSSCIALFFAKIQLKGCNIQITLFCAISGLTLDRVVIHAGQVFAPGQLGVGLGRVRHAQDVQLLGFRPSVCQRHPQRVYDFYSQPRLPLQPDLSCCRHPVPQGTFFEGLYSGPCK